MSDDPSSHVPDEFGDVSRDLVRASFGVDLFPETWEKLAREEQEKLLGMLASRIEEMMDHSFEQLLAILYRLDVDETKAQEAFSAPSRPAIARRLAELVLLRQIEVIRTRRKRPQ